MLTTEKGSNGPQYAVREQAFLEWFERTRPARYKEYVQQCECGGPAMWLNYLWLNGDTYVDSGYFKCCRVPIVDRRVYFRTFVQAVVQDIPFDAVDQFSEDTSPVYVPNDHDGRVKLNALLSVIEYGEDVVYIGSGPETVEINRMKEIATIELIDPFLAEPGTLLTYPIQGKTVINDAYYEGFEIDQLRLQEAPRYFAKKKQVAETDAYFVLPGSSEGRYTNDEAFKFVMFDYLAKLVGCRSRDEAITFALSKVVYAPVLRAARPKTMASRIEYANLETLEGEEVPFSALALFVPEPQVKCGGIVIAKKKIEELYREKPLREEHIEYLLRLLSQKESDKEEERKLYMEELVKYPVMRQMNWALVRGLKPLPEISINDDVREQFLDILYSEEKQGYLGRQVKGSTDFVDLINKLTYGQRVLHMFCGDGQYTKEISRAASVHMKSKILLRQHDLEDNRIDKTKFNFQKDCEGADWLLFVNVLHRNDLDIDMNGLRRFNILVIDYDCKRFRRDVSRIHEAGLCCAAFRPHFSVHTLQDFQILSTNGSFGSFCAVRYKVIDKCFRENKSIK